MIGLAYLQNDADWGDMSPGGTWATYPFGQPPPRLLHEDRCEAGCLSNQVMVRCLLKRNHDGLHVGHP